MKYETIAEYSNTKFRRITGVKRATFDRMVEILRKGYAEKHRRRGRKPKLSIEDMLLATLEYLREYRTYAHSVPKYAAQQLFQVSRQDISGPHTTPVSFRKQLEITMSTGRFDD